MAGSATPTTVASRAAMPDPSTVAATTQRPLADAYRSAPARIPIAALVIVFEYRSMGTARAPDKAADRVSRARCTHLERSKADRPVGPEGRGDRRQRRT